MADNMKRQSIDNNTSNQPTMKYLNAQQVADLCVDVVIPTLKSNDREVLQENQRAMRSLMIDNKVDSVRVHQIEPRYFANALRIAGIYRPAQNLWKALQRKLQMMKCIALKWMHIVNAVRHEMNDAIAQTVESAASKLGDFSKVSVKELISTIKTKEQRILTDAETRYLRALIKRLKKWNLILHTDSYSKVLVDFCILLFSSEINDKFTVDIPQFICSATTLNVQITIPRLLISLHSIQNGRN